MRLNDILAFAADGVKERKFRFALNIVGILIGGAAIVSLVSTAEGMSLEVNKQIELMGPKTIIVSSGGFGFMRSTGVQLTSRDLDKVERIPEVVMATPIIGRQVTAKIGGRSAFVQVVGIVPEEYMKIIKNIEVEKGRFLERSDTVSAVIGANIAQPPGEEEPLADIGDRLIVEISVGNEVRTATYRIAGILSPVGAAIAFSHDDAIYLSFRAAQQLFNAGNRISTIAIDTESLETVSTVVDAIRDRLGEGVNVISSDFIRETAGRIIGTIQAVLGGISAISLVVAGVGIINTMTISVMERTREIGILKAIGAKSRDILLTFLSEALMTGVLGGIVGVLIGILFSQVVSSLAQFSLGVTLAPSTSPSIAITVIVFSMMTGAIAGLYPAWRAANLRPVEALRYE